MTDLDQKIQNAFNANYKKPKSDDDSGYDMVYTLKNGEQKQTEHSKMDQTAWEQRQKESKVIIEENLSEDQKVLAAFK